MSKADASVDIVRTLPPSSLLRHVVDVHAHPTETEASEASSKVAELARSCPDKIIPCFGYHPWFSHLISLQAVAQTAEAKEAHYRALFIPDGSKDSNKETHLEAFRRVLPDLPYPFPLEELLAALRRNLEEFLSEHYADPVGRPKPMLGEVGLDRSFRVPFLAYGESEPPPSEDGPRLTPFFVPVAHQEAILEAQLALAIELGVNVSLHSVKAPAQTQAVFARMLARHGAKFDAISVDMHSCGVSVATWKDIERRYPNVYLSQSTVINFRSDAHRELIAACAPDRLLVESDISRIDQCAGRSWAILLRIAEVKGWHVEEDEWENGDEPFACGHGTDWGAVRRLEANWRAFEKAGVVRKEKRRVRKRKDASTLLGPEEED